MKRYWLSVFAVAALSVSCVTDRMAPAYSGEGDRTEVDSYGDEVVPGVVRIKLAEETEELNTGTFTRGAVETGNPALDKLAAEWGATEVRRVFPEDKKYEARHRKYGLHLWYDIVFDEGVPVSRAAAGVDELEGIEYVSPVYKAVLPSAGDDAIVQADAPVSYWGGSKDPMPYDDPYLPWQWNFHNDGTMTNSRGEVVAKAGADINLFDAWELYGAGSPDVIVAVMDQGVQWDHPDLQANIWTNPSPGVEGEDTYYNDLHGWNFRVSSPDIVPGSHGTHVAGIIAAENNNGIGVAGVAGGTGKGDGVKIMSCQMFQEGDYAVIAPAAYVYAADHGAVISQNSWNYGMNFSSVPKELTDAFQYFVDNAGWADNDGDGENDTFIGPVDGGIICFSTSNSYTGSVALPATDKNVIAVSSIRPDYVKAQSANYGSGTALSAPGGATGDTDSQLYGDVGKVYSTIDGGSYGYKAGTSMACPQVSGVAALIISKYGGKSSSLTAEEVKERLMRCYRPIAQYQESEAVGNGMGAGLVDASMIGLEKPAAPAAPENVVVEAPGGGMVYIEITIPADGNGLAMAGFKVEYALADTDTWESTTLTNVAEVGAVDEFNVTGLEHNSDYVIRIYSIDRFGSVSEDYKEFEVTTANVAPSVAKQFSMQVFPQSGEDPNVLKLNVAEHFSDADLPNDALTYSSVVKEGNPVIVSLSVEGDILTMKAIATGETTVTVIATDSFGETASANMFVQVKEYTPDVVANVELPNDTAEEPFVSRIPVEELFENVEGVSIVAVSSNEEIASAVIEGGELVVTGYKKGVANITVTSTDTEGTAFSVVVEVHVTANQSSEGATGLSVVTNPVDDELGINLVGADGAADVTLYDAAARKVAEFAVTFDRGVAEGNDVSALAPGIYSLVVEYNGGRYSTTFVKR